MYRHARSAPKMGFRPGGLAGSVDNGPSEAQRAAIDIYKAKLEAQRQRDRERSRADVRPQKKRNPAPSFYLGRARRGRKAGSP